MSLSGAIEPDRLDRDRQRERRYGVLLALAVFISLILLDRPLVRGDGLSYYMWLEPIAVHRSFELEYAAAKFGGVNEYQIFRAPNGKWASAFPFGPAVFLSPWYLAGQALPNVTNVDDDHFAKYQADTFFHSFIVMLGSNFYTVLAALLAYKTSLRLRASPFWAAFAALALIWGTPLIFYSTVEPYMAHSIGAFLVSLLFALLTLRRVPWFLAGLCVSLAILVRWQLALVAVPLLVLLLWRRQLAPTLRFLLGIASLAWLVPLSWYSMFGSPFVVPAAVQNSRPFLGWPVHALDVLFAANNGLFAWAPLTAMSTLGLILLWCRGARAFVLVALSAFVLQVLINGGVSDWGAGWSYGMRRLSELYPLFVVGLAVLLTGEPSPFTYLMRLLALLLTAFSMVLLLAHLVYINYFAGHGGSVTEVLSKWASTLDNPRLTWQVIKEHYGPWAWPKPGP